MKEWKPELKRYPHFDKYLPEEKIIQIVKDPHRVASNAFFPFILYNKETERFERKSKIRPIRYAARRDAYIFSYYRHILSALYEEKLISLGIQECPIAYRKIPIEIGKNGGKCNIHFAKDAFQEVLRMGSCYALAIDISNFFESLDHLKLEALWCELLNENTLPSDHKAVFNAITKYAIVDLDKCYERLGYKGEVEINGKKKRGFKIDPRKIPMQLCSMKDFRDKICGKDKKYSDLVEKNKNNYGIPQGSPISDLLANIYLIPFDKEIKEFANENGCYYRRYSDDILFLCPSVEGLFYEAINKIKNCIQKSGERLIIKDEKTNITHFITTPAGVIAATIQPISKQKPFEYLGFSFDGKTVKLRDNTVSKYYRNMTFGIRMEAINLVKFYADKSPEEILKFVKISDIYQRYGKIKEFNDSSDYTSWNFWTYAKRASMIMKPLENIILHQLRNHKKKIITLLKNEIQNQYIENIKKQINKFLANS